MPKLQPGSMLPVRTAIAPGVADAEKEPPKYYTEYALTRIARNMDRIAKLVLRLESAVEEYETNSTEGPEGITTITVQPDYYQKVECITSVLVAGPPSTAFTLQLGGRYLSLVTDVSGKVLLAPVAFYLKPSDPRILTSVTEGNWFLQLSGNAA
jgi:hypothetical protein